MDGYLIKKNKIKFFPGKFTDVTQKILERIRRKKSCIVLPFSLNDLAAISNNPQNVNVYQQIDLCTTDGMPIVWWFRLHNIPAERVYGPDLMREIVIHTQKKQVKHFLLGSSPLILRQLHIELVNIAPKINIVGSFSPPYRPLTSTDIKQMKKKVQETHASIVWIGISSPKQVLLATSLKKFLPKTSFFCVGAAFDIVSKIKPAAPKIIQRMGLEWLFRVILEPKRLWRRYFVDIPLCFIKLAGKNIVFT